MSALDRIAIDIESIKKIIIIFPILTSLFFLFMRGLSTSAVYVVCIVGLLLAIFSDIGFFKNRHNSVSWYFIAFVIGSIFAVSVILYFYSSQSFSYLESPYSIILQILPFIAFFKVLEKDEAIVYALMLLFIGSGILSYWFGGQNDYGARVISSRYFKLLYFAPLLIAFKWMQISWKSYLVISIFGVIGSVVVMFITFYLFDFADGYLIDEFVYQDAVAGNTNPIFFGLITLCLIVPVLLAININLIKSRHKVALSIISILGVCSVLMTGSRGVWLSLFAVLFIYLIVCLFNIDVSKKSKAITASAILVIIFIFISTPVAQNRISQAFENIESYKNSVSRQDDIHTNSLGIRLELWKSAIKIFKENILLGAGPGSYNEELSHLAERGELSSKLLIFKQAHSQYFHTLATKGMIGIFILIIVFLGFISVSLNFIFSQKTNRYVSFVASCSSYFLLCYIFLGLTEAPLERRSTIVFFTFFYALSIATMKCSEKKSISINT